MADADQDARAERVVIYANSNVSRGKFAAAAVHAALTAAGVHPGLPVIVLGAKPGDIEGHSIVIRDAGLTEVEPGTVTAGTNWPGPSPAPAVELASDPAHPSTEPTEPREVDPHPDDAFELGRVAGYDEAMRETSGAPTVRAEALAKWMRDWHDRTDESAGPQMYEALAEWMLRRFTITESAGVERGRDLRASLQHDSELGALISDLKAAAYWEERPRTQALLDAAAAALQGGDRSAHATAPGDGHAPDVGDWDYAIRYPLSQEAHGPGRFSYFEVTSEDEAREHLADDAAGRGGTLVRAVKRVWEVVRDARS